MILARVLTAVALLIIAADFSAIDGRWAHDLGLPLSDFAQWSFWLVPVAALLSFALPRRMPVWPRILACSLVALGLVVFPIAVFEFGSHSVIFSGASPSGLTEQLRKELGFPVIIVSNRRGSHVHFPRAHNPSLVRDALHRYGINPKS